MKFIESALISAIHQQPCQGVVAVTGGGAGLIAKLLSVPGASQTVLEALVPYSPQAFTEFLQTEPDQYCSAQTTVLAATRAFERAQELSSDGTTHLFGMAITASLRSSQPKKGAHRFYLALCTAENIRVLEVLLTKEARTRSEEEELVAQAGLQLLSELSEQNYQVEWLQTDGIKNYSLPSGEHLKNMYQREKNVLWYRQGQGYLLEPTMKPHGLLCGAFNPLHDGHRQLRIQAETYLNGPVAFEMAIINAEKPVMHPGQVLWRLPQFDQAPVVITDAPMFYQKAKLFPETCFIIGMDTALRLVDPRFYEDNVQQMHAALTIIEEQGCRFLVAARRVEGELLTAEKLIIEHKFQHLFSKIETADFLMDISSTMLRNQTLY